MKNRMKHIWRWLPSFIWMGFIFFLSSRSTIGIGQTKTERFLILKTFHLIEYGVLFGLMWWAAKKRNMAILLSLIYAASDEIHQYFVPGREGRPRDVLIDFLGIMLTYFIINALCRVARINRLWKKHAANLR